MPNKNTDIAPRIDNTVLVAVLQAITSGLNYSQLVKYLSDKGVEVTPQNLPVYFSAAHEHYTHLANYARDVETGKAISRLQSLYAASLSIQDYRSCLAIQKELNALMGLKDNTPGKGKVPQIEVTIPASKKRKARK